MENEYVIPASIFDNLPELFEPCQCGRKPNLSVYVHSSGTVMFSVWCPDCDRDLNFFPSHFDGNLDFGALAVRWNNLNFRGVI